MEDGFLFQEIILDDCHGVTTSLFLSRCHKIIDLLLYILYFFYIYFHAIIIYIISDIVTTHTHLKITNLNGEGNEKNVTYEVVTTGDSRDKTIKV